MISGVLLIGFIWINALWLQPGKHPSPLFDVMEAVRQPAPPPLPQLRHPVPPSPAAVPETRVNPRDAMVRDLQDELSRLGYYEGKVDGLTGPKTEAAVRAYQAARGLPVTGEGSADLLEQVRRTPQTAAPVRVATPPIRPEETTSSVQPRQTAPSEPPAAVEQPATAPAGTQTASSRQAGDGGDFRLIRSVQQALADLGYAPGPVNGTMTGKTQDAIRRFQADRAMPVTGKLGVTLVLELETVSGVALNR